MSEEFSSLKINSRIKHLILKDYLPAWEAILGRYHGRMLYFDCYAGPGSYRWRNKEIEGSPVIAIQTAGEWLKKNPRKEMRLVFIEEDANQKIKLEKAISEFRDNPKNLYIEVISGKAEDIVSKLLADVKNLAPAFFFLDPYGHPLEMYLIREILKRQRTEVLINFMYYQINRDIGNSLVEDKVTKLFGTTAWKDQPFVNLSGSQREQGILDYYIQQLGVRYYIPFKIRFGSDEKVAASRTKYYLIHATNHFLGFDKMLEAMWKHGSEGSLDCGDGQMVLFPEKTVDSLKDFLRGKYCVQEIAFDKMREENWRLYYREKEFRESLQVLKKENKVEFVPVTSKTERGCKGNDRIRFVGD